MKMGRNEKCPCGSGKKYKKCCLKNISPLNNSIPLEVIQYFQKVEDEKTRKEILYGKIKPIISTDYAGQKMVAVGDRLYYSKKWKMFPDFLMDYIVSILEPEWCQSEHKKPYDTRHQILKWYDKICEFHKKQTPDSDNIYRVMPSGCMAAYLSLAYDLYILRHHQALQDYIIKRLKHPDQFQGARYELFVTATCIRAGFNIEFENEQDRTKKHPEFIIRHKETGEKFSVEAKSKHREGVLGYHGQTTNADEIKLKIGKLINKAIEKKNEFPNVIFIDLNLPYEVAKNIIGTQPPNKISKILEQIAKKDNKDQYNMLVFTNYCHHYGKDNETDPPKITLAVISQKPEIISRNPQHLLELRKATLQYGHIPNEFQEINDSGEICQH